MQRAGSRQFKRVYTAPEVGKGGYALTVQPCQDAFWAGKRAASQAIQLKATYASIDAASHPELQAISHKSLVEQDMSPVEIRDVQVSCLGKDLSGILAMPRQRQPRSLPAVLFLNGAGVRPCEPGRFVRRAACGAMVYEINAHRIQGDPGKRFGCLVLSDPRLTADGSEKSRNPKYETCELKSRT